MTLKTITRCLLLTTLITILLLTQTISIATDVTEIHSPDFPEYLDSIPGLQNETFDYAKYIQLLKELLSSANESETLSELMNDGTSREDLSNLINMMKVSGDSENARQVETLMNYSSLDLNELLRGMEDDRLAELLREAFSSGLVSEDLLRVIGDMYASGEISFDDYVRALYALQRTSELSGNEELVKRIDSLLLAQLTNSLSDSALRLLENPAVLNYLLREGLTRETLEAMFQFLNSSPEYSEDVLSALRYLLGSESSFSTPLTPSFRFPPLDMHASIPTLAVDTNTLATLALAVTGFLLTSTLLLLKRRRISGMISQVALSLSRKTYHFNSEVVNIYWSSVDLLSRRVQKGLNETHREYFNKVYSTMPEVGRLFKNITEAYERVRWGAQDESAFVGRVTKEYDELRKVVGRT